MIYLRALLFSAIVSIAVHPLWADVTIPLDASALGGQTPGVDAPPFIFTTATDGTLTVNAQFITQWLAPAPTVNTFLKATSFVIDGIWYPAQEDFYGYMDPSTWPSRAIHTSQQIVIQESVFLSAGMHTIQFRNGLMERDTSNFIDHYSFTHWLTASMSISLPNRPTVVRIDQFPAAPEASITPTTQSVAQGTPASFSLAQSHAIKTIFAGTDGTQITDPDPIIAVIASEGSYTFRYIATGSVQIRWLATGADRLWIDPPVGAPVDITRLLSYTATISGDYTLRALQGNQTTSAPFHVDLPTSSASASLVVTAPIPVARRVSFNDAAMTFGTLLALTSTSSGDGAPIYSVIQGPGSVSGASLNASSVGTVQVRVDYPATARFLAGSAVANVIVNPEPVSFTLNDQDFDFDGTAKTAFFSVSDPLAVSSGMVNTVNLTQGPAVNTYPVSVSATGNYVGTASARLRIIPVIDRFRFNAPTQPQITSFVVPSSIQWPASPVIVWATANTSAVIVADDSGNTISTNFNDRVSAQQLDVRDHGYIYAISASPLPGSFDFAQRGAAAAHLQGPGLDADVTGMTSFPITTSGLYTYTVSSNGVSRSASFDARIPPVATQSANVTVTPATVVGTWPNRSVDGPYALVPGDLPTWTIQTGEAAPAGASLAWTRSDDGAQSAISLGDVVIGGSYQFTASFTPPNSNYSAAQISAHWAVTVPITVNTSNTSITVNLNPAADGSVLRILPGTTLTFSATPVPNFAWGADWDAQDPTIWTGSNEIIPSPSQGLFSTTVPAAVARLSIAATAYQLGPRVTHFTPLTSSFTVPSGPAAGQTYRRTWQADDSWNAYLARDGVSLSVSGSSRENSIAEFEVQARAPNHDWSTLASGPAMPSSPNGPRLDVTQTFSVRFGEVNSLKPLLPADPTLAGLWTLRARVRNSIGTWSSWSEEQSFNVLMPLQTVMLQGRTLPPVQDAGWFQASSMRSYPLQMLVP